MQYRKFGRSGEEISILGFGAMRLPVVNGEEGRIDEAHAINMLRYSIENGVNYVDTAWPYHQKTSELFVGKALQELGYRDKVNVATKLPSWLIKSRADMDYYLNEQLKRLQTDHIDYYLVHSLNKDFWANLTRHNVFDFLEKALADGRIRHAGFSYHDGPALFKEIVDAYNWEFCQIQHNYVDLDFQAGRQGLDYAAARGLGIIIMEPLKGGKLAGRVPQDVQAVWNRVNPNRSAAEWALRFLWDDPRIGIVLSGASSLPQVEENIRIAAAVSPSFLLPEEKALYTEARLVYESRTKVACTQCKYCMPCPADLNLPDIFKYYNRVFMFEDSESTRQLQKVFGPEKSGACIDCGKCEAACPQHLAIRQKLAEASDYLNTLGG